ncbi:MAG: AbrB/MazE/SpoVT family DNA-binding domain-containing protein [Armatimonadetes bacterium]|nr:AbrB/MazE/SpoVT family DNA-binding domain-containing protein [Armatimonadota bacterium]
MGVRLSLEENFFGSATVGERGQVVIPADARKKFGINPGDKVLVMGHPEGAGILLFKIDSIREMLSALIDGLSKIESRAAEAEADEEQNPQ